MGHGPAHKLLAWYDAEGRDLPWRAKGGGQPDPYHVWLSEIMPQQTTVATVKPYFGDFVARWPKLADLAAAPLDDVLKAWAGLGYYARARNLHKCAGVVAADHGGLFPEDEAELLKLPGIGPYTAAALAAIAFGQPATVVDGNVERVMARLYGLEEPLPQAKPRLRTLAAGLTPKKRPGDYAQAVMDLGATVCKPRSADCGACPWAKGCVAHRKGLAGELPRRTPKQARPTRRGVAFFLRRGDGAVLLRRRAEKGLLGGMMEVPGTPWRVEPWGDSEALGHAPLAADWRPVEGGVRHTFTHFHLELDVRAASVGVADDELPGALKGEWIPADELAGQALPTVMKKVIGAVLGS